MSVCTQQSNRVYLPLAVATPPNGATQLAICPDCGALVVNTTRHNNWHDETRGTDVNQSAIADDAGDTLDRHEPHPNGQHDGWWECRCGEPHTGRHLIGVLIGAGFDITKGDQL